MEPERPIEKALRKLAAKRRAEQGAEFELHPATRRLLQGEVSRRYARGTRNQPSSWTTKLFGSFWMRAAWSASLIVVLGFFLASDLTHRSDRAQLASVSPEPEVAGKKPPKDFFSSKTDGNSSSDLGKEMQLTTNLAASRTNPELAKNMAGKESEARKNELADAPGPEPASPPLENPALAGNQDAFAPSTRARDRKLGLEALASTSATAGTVPAQAPQGAALASAPAFKTKPLPSNVESNTAAAALNPALSVARVEQLRDSIGNGFQNSQQFVAERTGSKKARAAPQAILDQFSLSQQGSQLRVQDLDGSVYLGEVVPESNLPANDKTVLGNRRMASPPGTTLRTSGSDSIARADQFYFQVSGTNRSLNRRVIFRGRVETSNEITFDTAATNRSRTYGLIGGSASNSSQSNQQQYRNTANQMQLNLQNSRVSGTAEIEGIKNQEIQAIPSR